MCLRFVILCGIVCQGIIGTFAEFNESSAILVRQKRVFSRLENEDISVSITDRKYIVMVKLRGRLICAGSILTQYYVITSPYCTRGERVTSFTVTSRSSRTNRGTNHYVIQIKVHSGNIPGRPLDGVALLKVHPPFVYSRYTSNITLYTGDLFTRHIAQISGWGSACSRDHGSFSFETDFPYNLRSIDVPILKHGDCVNRYRYIHVITDKDVCTYHRQRKCAIKDGGAPLVIEDRLAGVRLWSGRTLGGNDPDYPDVFAIVESAEYRIWILENIRN